MKIRHFLFLLALAAACERAADDSADAANDSASADTTAAAVDTSRPLSGAVAPTKFDPAKVKAGDRFGGLTVARVRRPPDDYIVSFNGQVELNGSYRAHFDYPEVKLPCFWVDPDSWAKLPRSISDPRLLWFCFENADEAIKQLGALGTQARATIIIENYQTMLNQSDVIDRAKLVRVLRKEPI